MTMRAVTIYYAGEEVRWHVLVESASAARAKARDLGRRVYGLDDSTYQFGFVSKTHAVREGRLFPPALRHRRRWRLRN